jgi:predicted RecB family nuclease
MGKRKHITEFNDMIQFFKKTKFDGNSTKVINEILRMNHTDIVRPKQTKKIMMMPEEHDYRSPSQFFQWCKKDPFQDVLSKHPSYFINNFNKKTGLKSNQFNQFLMDQGNKFEFHVKEYFKNTLNLDVVELPMHNSGTSDTTIYQMTLKAMEDGRDIIYQSCLFNPHHKLYGHPDFLIRSDKFNMLSHNSKYPTEYVNAKSRFGNYHYIVMDTKFHTLKLNSTQSQMLNTSSELYYKVQLYIYTLCLDYVQNFMPAYAYIIGRGYASEHQIKKIKYKCGSNNIFDTLGVVNTRDIKSETIKSEITIPLIIEEAANWQNILDTITVETLNEVSWNNPFNEYFRPNMLNQYTYNSDVGDFDMIRTKIAELQGEPTLIAHIGNRERELLHDNGIYSIYDSRCTLNAMNMTRRDVRYKNIETRLMQAQDTQNVLPLIQCRNISNQKLSPVSKSNRNIIVDTLTKNYMVLDLEVSNNTDDDFGKLPLSKNDNCAYFIGLINTAITDNDGYIAFVSDDLTNETELINFQLFISYMEPYFVDDGLKNNAPYVFVWSKAENNFLNRLLSKFDDNLTDKDKLIVKTIQSKLVDMCRMFEIEEIIIKGTHSLGLKNVAKQLYAMKLIPTTWKQDISGISSMMAVNILNKEAHESQIKLYQHPKFKDMVDYNRVDCQVIVDIINWLHTKVSIYNHNHQTK